MTIYHSGRVQNISLFKGTESKTGFYKEAQGGQVGEGENQMSLLNFSCCSRNKAVILPGFSNLSVQGNHLGFLFKIDSDSVGLGGKGAKILHF